MKNKYLWTGVIAGSVLALDQLTKLLVMQHIPRFGVIRVIQGFLELTNVRNPGAAFGILANAAAGWRAAFFITVAFAALAVIALLVRRTSDRLSLIAFALIGGGAVGNLVDRIRFGEVVDFISVYIWSRVSFLNPWPTFNVADAAITVGVVLMTVEMLFFQKTTKEPISKS